MSTSLRTLIQSGRQELMRRRQKRRPRRLRAGLAAHALTLCLPGPAPHAGLDDARPSPRLGRGPLPSRAQQEARSAALSTLDSADPLSGLRRVMSALAEVRGEWAGIPMPLDRHNLVVEPTYAHAQALMDMYRPAAGGGEPKFIVRNSWWSDRLRGTVVLADEGGRVVWAVLRTKQFDLDMETLGASSAWGIEQESRALQFLGTLVRHHQMRQYLLTGMFLETSPRSGLTYLFRRLRPTLVVDARDKTATRTRILCALCLHPIAFYAGSWAGAMVPTDDVVAHLVLMRGDEAMLWRRANQHLPARPEAAC